MFRNISRVQRSLRIVPPRTGYFHMDNALQYPQITNHLNEEKDGK